MTNGPLWVFDDPSRGLVEEPFMDEASKVLDGIAERIGAKNEMVLVFSATPIPDHTFKAKRIGSGAKADEIGCMYKFEEAEFWLCPATTKYFPDVPEVIYVKAYPAK